MADNKFVRAAPDDPNRCKGSMRDGQCPWISVPGGEVCIVHGGNKVLKKQEVERTRLYNLAKYQVQLDKHVDHDQAKSLREEIGILRILLEGIMNQCQDQTDLLLYSNKISDLAVKIEKLVSSCHRLEASTGMLLDKHAALKIATQVVGIIGMHIDDEAVLEIVSQQIAEAILGSTPEEQ